MVGEDVSVEAAIGSIATEDTAMEAPSAVQPPVGVEPEDVGKVEDVVQNPPGDSVEVVAAATDEVISAADGADAALVAGDAEDVPKDAEPVVEAATEGIATNGGLGAIASDAPVPATGHSSLLAPPKLVLKLGKAATASLKAAAAAKAQKLAAASAASGGAAPPSPEPAYSFPSASLSASESYDLLGGNSAASSSWSPTDHADSGEMLPLDLRDEVISPPTTFAEANAEGGIPKAHPGKARYTEVLGGKQCSMCLHVLRAWAGTHIKSHEMSNKHKEAIERREGGIPLGGRRRKPKPPRKPRVPKAPKVPKPPKEPKAPRPASSKRTTSRARKPAVKADDGEEVVAKKATPKAAAKGTKAAAGKGTKATATAKGKGKAPVVEKKAATKRKAPASDKKEDAAAGFPKVVKRRRN